MWARSTHKFTKDTWRWPHWADGETNSTPSDSGGRQGPAPGVSRSVVSQLLLKFTATGGFMEISHKGTEDGTGNFLLQDEAGGAEGRSFIFIIKNYKGTVIFKYDGRFLYRS